MVVAGIDIGFRTVKVVLLEKGAIVSHSVVAAEIDVRDSCVQALREALAKANLAAKDILHITVTGTGRKSIPFATDEVMESAAIAKGAVALFPLARTVIDVGAEGSKAIRCDDKGNVVDFVRNEKCAAGAGAFVEAMARALEVEVEEMGALSLQAQHEIQINATCVVFTESEVVSLVHAGTSKADIARSIHDAIATRTASMISRIGGVREKLVISGGMAKNSGMLDSLKQLLGNEILIPAEPQIVAALGAALFAAQHDKGYGRKSLSGILESPHSASSTNGVINLFDSPATATPRTPREFWKWEECNWKAPDKDWRDAKILTAGVDVGSVSSKAVILADGELYAYSSVRTGSGSSDSARKVIDATIGGIGIKFDDLRFIVGTGYGRANVPFAQKTLTEISCHARGANFLGGTRIRTILDMGGQDCKVIRCDAQGKVTSFLMNDKCAAGTGRGLEVMSDLLQVPINELGPLSLSVDELPPIVSSTCIIFAKSEAMSLLRQGWSKAAVLAAFCDAIARRIVILLQRVGMEEEFTITGGIAKNVGVVKRIEKALAVKAVAITPDPQIVGAAGAALFASDLFARSAKNK